MLFGVATIAINQNADFSQVLYNSQTNDQRLN